MLARTSNKLCLGNSRVVLLDELTAGVDTGARRDIERLLIQQKKERFVNCFT